MAKKTSTSSGRMTESVLVAALQTRYPKAEYAFLEQVRNSTGLSRHVRTADALALSLWPSRGLHLHGFEIKQYGGDWKREKVNPAKAEEIARFCDYWWLVITHSSVITDRSEIPEPWGLLQPDDEGKKLVIVKPAVKNESPEPWTRGFMAAILRNASDASEPARAVAAKLEAARQAGITVGQGKSPENEAERELKRLRELETRVEQFEKASGLSIRYGYAGPEKVGAAVGVVLHTIETHRRFISTVQAFSTRLAADVQADFDRLKDEAARVEQSLKVQMATLDRELAEPSGEQAYL